MVTELKQHYVAFLDILGFTNMVKTDITSEDQPYLRKLYRCHQRASHIFSDDPNISITQFSDSIVVAKPFESGSFEWFVKKIAEYQNLLLKEGLLCRGGIAVNKHFSNGSFTFSAGLIDAYDVESTLARYPRVVISSDLIELIFPDTSAYPDYLIIEDDGLVFIDYLSFSSDSREAIESIRKLSSELMSCQSTSLKEKGLWLAGYSDSVLGTSLAPSRFKGLNILGQ